MTPVSTTQSSEVRLSDFKVPSKRDKPTSFPKRTLTNGTPSTSTSKSRSQSAANGDSAPKKKDKSKKKHKDKHEKKPSKKRRRDEDEGEESESSVEAELERPASPTKRRKSEATRPSSQKTSRGATSSSTAASRAQHTPGLAEAHFRQATLSLYLPVPPISQSYTLHGICALNLSPLLLTYFEPAKGMVIAYDNVRVSEEPDNPPSRETALARTVDIYGIAYVWVTADFTVFTPCVGQPIEGYVNIQTESHIGLVCWNLFSASIDRRRLPPDWKWVEAAGDDGASLVSGGNGPQRGEGHFVDGEGKQVEGVIEFRISEVEPPYHSREEKTFLTIRGTLLDEEDEEKLVQEEREAQRKARQRLINLGPRGR